ncbi:MAG TPA: hypothetical protein VMW64_08120 [Dehalococcoidia bacterium]|nr:hypothetical protein [Dehalococcoidia bacterium]
MEQTKLTKGVWFWQKEWWRAIALKELIARKLKDNPGDSVTVSVIEINNMLDELAGSFRKRLRGLATFPVRVSIIKPRRIIIIP